MNEPANFVTGSSNGCENNALNLPPYKPSKSLTKSLCFTDDLKLVNSAHKHIEPQITLTFVLALKSG